jgi:HD-GYP domain-containing protein (c-di-GMP phosphodiesterase class II)
MAGQLLAKLSTETAEKISSGGEILIHLLGDKKGEGPQFHALNVMTLSMILGKSLKLSEGELSDLALGALAHDVGKARIPPHLLKAKTRAKHEEDFYRAHVQYGLELAREAAVFSIGSLSIIADHHEFLNGSGFPRGNRKPSPLAQIVGLVNRYDRLCGPESPDKPSLMPAEALSVLFAREADKFDEKLLGLLVKTLGVYPPGTIIMLNDGSLGLVVSPGRNSLRPEILIYDPDVDKAEAIVIDMSDTPDLKIEESVRPSNLPSDVLFWLNPRQRLSYFFSMESAAD